MRRVGPIAPGLLVCAALVSGCKKKSPRPLYSDAELTAMEQALDGLLAENQRKQCKRPVLRGAPSDGPADADIVALVEPQGSLQACRHLVAGEHHARVNDALAAPPATPLPAELAELGKTCAGVGAAFTKAASHQDACSPYLLGRRGEAEFLALIQLGKAATLEARELARAGKPADAVRLLLDVARVGQDLGRGGGALIHGMVGVTSSVTALHNAADIAASSAPMSPEDVSALEHEVEVLMGSEPHVRELVLGQVDYLRGFGSLPNLKPKRFQLPAGWPPGARQWDAKETAPLSLRDVAGLIYEAAARQPAAFLAACGEGASLMTCAQAPSDPGGTIGLLLPDRANVDFKPDLDGMLFRLKDAGGGQDRRAKLVAALEQFAAPAYARYVGQYTRRTLTMARLRLQLRARRTLPCPTPAEPGELAAALEVPGYGEQLTLRAAPGGVQIEWPKWAAQAQGSADELTIACPPQ